MTSITNHKSLPFFERIPPRARPIVERARQRSSAGDTAEMVALAHKLMCLELRQAGIDGPAIEEFRTWAENVRIPVVDIADQIMERAITPDDADPAFHAFQIIVQAWKLRGALIEAGYSPESCDNGDQLVAEAIEEWLKAEANDAGMTTTAVDIAVSMLEGLDGKEQSKLLSLLASGMQAELLRAIVHEGGRS